MKALLLIPFLVTSLFSQQKAPPKLLRIIPLGEEPTLKQGVLNDKGILVIPPPPKGSVLPSPLAFKTGEVQSPLQLALLTFTPPLSIPSDIPDYALRNTKTNVDWLAKKTPRIPLSLGVLYRNPQTMSWDNPQFLLLRDDAASFPAAKVRFVNTSEKMVLFRIGKSAKPTTYGVAPGGASVKQLKVGANQIWIGYKDAKGKITDYPFKMDIVIKNNERAQFFFYKPQAKNPRKPFLIFKKVEQVPKS